MPDFTSIENSLRRAIVLAAGACLALFSVTVASLLFAVSAGRQASELRARMPLLVVPGAVAGTYTPGLTDDAVRATARYLTGLVTNFNNGKSLQDRFDELEAFASPRLLPQLQSGRDRLVREVETQNQSRSFIGAPQTENFYQTEPGRFRYSIDGERVVYSSGLPMTTQQSQVALDLLWGTPSERNRAGIVLDALEVTDLPAKKLPPATLPAR